MPFDPLFALAALTAVFLAGISKGGFAGGAAFAAVPVLTLASSPQVAVGVLLPVFLLMDVIAVWRYRGQWRWASLKPLMLASVIGVILGALTYEYVSDRALKALIGVTALAFLLFRFIGGGSEESRADGPRIWGLGAAAGYTSFIAHAGAPLTNMALLPQRMNRTQFHATTTMFFFWVNGIKIPPYAMLGLLAPSNLLASLALVPIALASVALGMWLHQRVSDRGFFMVIYTLLLVVSVKLIYDGLFG